MDAEKQKKAGHPTAFRYFRLPFAHFQRWLPHLGLLITRNTAEIGHHGRSNHRHTDPDAALHSEFRVGKGMLNGTDYGFDGTAQIMTAGFGLALLRPSVLYIDSALVEA